jgi:hypothetical protein
MPDDRAQASGQLHRDRLGPGRVRSIGITAASSAQAVCAGQLGLERAHLLGELTVARQRKLEAATRRPGVAWPLATRAGARVAEYGALCRDFLE